MVNDILHFTSQKNFVLRTRFAAGIIFLFLAANSFAGTLVFWNFNSVTPDNDPTTGTLEPAIGVGAASLVGGVTASFTASNGSSDSGSDNSNWRITTWPSQGIGNKQNGVEFRVSTVGRTNILLKWDLRNSNTASKYTRLQYTTNGTGFIDFSIIAMPAETWINGQSVDFSSVPGVNNNPNFGVRFVTEFETTATGSGADGYVPSSSTNTYGNGGTLRFDLVEFADDPAVSAPATSVKTFSVVSYNIWGANFEDTEANWNTNNARIQQIGRELKFLNADVIGFQEFAITNRGQVTNWVKDFLPGYFVATNSTTAGGPPNIIVSRFPIVRSQSWLARASLSAFGYNGVFARDLFEAEIVVPGMPEHVHVFNVHLKAFADQDNALRRGAEALCLSNWFVTVFLQGPNRTHPYLLMGDMNEDIFRPRTYEQNAINRMANDATGLRLTTPRNPVTNDERTWSIQNSSLTIRFDYIFPSGLLFSNMNSAQVFRSDLSSPSNPFPGWLLSTDSLASDHLPVVMTFNNPFWPFSTSIHRAGSTIDLSWESLNNARYRVESSSNLVQWAQQASFVAAGTNTTWEATANASEQFYRVVRE